MPAHAARLFLACLFTAAMLLPRQVARAGTGSASPPSFWPGTVDTIEVQAERPTVLQSMARRSSFSTYIPLGKEAPVGRDLSDLLDRAAGLHVHRYGGLGAFSLASVRGSTPGQVTICLDGVPVAAAGDGFVNLATLPANALDHAEIYRGPQTLSFGGPPAAGVINLVTPPALPAPLRLSVGQGSFGTTVARGQWGSAWRHLSGFFSGQYRRSRGDYPYLDRNGTDFENTSDDRVVRRSNDDFAETSLLWKLAFSPPAPDASPATARFQLGYTGQAYAHEGGVPGTESIQTHHVRFRTARTRHEISMQLPARRRWLPDLEVSLHTDLVHDRFDNRFGEVGLGRVFTDDRTLEEGGRIATSLALPAQALRLSWERRNEGWSPHDLLSETEGYTRTRRHSTLSIEDRLALGRLSLEGAYRWARATDNYGGPIGAGENGPTPARTLRDRSPTFGARLDLGHGLVARANHGKLARFPSFSELFGQNGVQEGNPALRPETGTQWDAGFSYGPRAPVRLEEAWFESLVRDQISLIQNSQQTTRAENLDRSWIRGLESSLYSTWSLPSRIALEVQATHTWQLARDVGASPVYAGKALPNLPPAEAYLSSQLGRGGWKLRWEISARSASFRDRYNTAEKRTPPYVLHDLSLERSLGRGTWLLRAEARNLFNLGVEDIDGFPLPGRSYMTEVTWTR